MTYERQREQPTLGLGCRALCEGEDGMTVVGSVDSGRRAQRVLRNLTGDLTGGWNERARRVLGDLTGDVTGRA